MTVPRDVAQTYPASAVSITEVARGLGWKITYDGLPAASLHHHRLPILVGIEMVVTSALEPHFLRPHWQEQRTLGN